jgi:hypothetical protein
MRLKDAAINLAVMAASLAVALLALEFVVFRYVWLASDVPVNAYADEVVRYAPNQRGVWRVRDEIAAAYRINAQGWNSGSGDYARERRPGVERVAVIGDSYVESMQVAAEASFGELLPPLLGRPAEVLRFGISGAPMSQYLHMLEREVAAYRPDRIVVLLVHNDFDESFRRRQGRYTSSFRLLEVAGGAVAREVPPEPWRPGPGDWLRRTATARFLLYRWQVRPQAIVDLFLPPARADGRVAANVRIDEVLAAERDVAAAADHVIRRLGEESRRIGAELLLVMDGDRAAIEAGAGTSDALRLNAIAAAAAERHGVRFLDLHPAFAADFAASRRPFGFASDGHWNEHGHAVAARAIAAALR